MASEATRVGNAVCVGCGKRPASPFARLSSWLSAPIGARRASARAGYTRMEIEGVLNALPADAPEDLREAIASGCCTYYTVAEGFCGSSGCGTGNCCYHIVSTACGKDVYQCVNHPCSYGNYSTGC